MANRNKTRIEPTFDGPARTKSVGGLSVSEDDRVLPRQRKQSAGKRRSERRTRGSRTRKRGGFFGGFARLFYWCFVLALWGGIAAAGVVAWYGAKMPSATSWAIPDRSPNIKIVSVDGKLLANRGMTGGEAVGLHEMSPYIPQAVMAIEDRRFYSHFGIDPIGLARAMFENITQRPLHPGRLDVDPAARQEPVPEARPHASSARSRRCCWRSGWSTSTPRTRSSKCT